MCSRWVYWLKVPREQGLSRGQLHSVFLALIVSRLHYALPSWSGFLSREQIGQINAYLKRIYRCDFSCQLIQLETLTSTAVKRLFANICCQVHCLHSLLPPATNYSVRHCPTGHPFELSYLVIIMTWVVKVLYQDAFVSLNSIFGAPCTVCFYIVFLFVFILLLFSFCFISARTFDYDYSIKRVG